MDIKEVFQAAADRLKVEAESLFHSAEQHANLQSIKRGVGNIAAWGSGHAQRLADELAAIDAQVQTDFTDYHE